MVNIIEEFVKIIAGLDISRVTVFRVYAKIKKLTGAMYDKKTLTLHLSYPQSIYRWFKGIILPSVDHLYVLSRLLKIHMEDLLVPIQEEISITELHMDCISSDKRLYEYWRRLCVKKCA